MVENAKYFPLLHFQNVVTILKDRNVSVTGLYTLMSLFFIITRKNALKISPWILTCSFGGKNMELLNSFPFPYIPMNKGNVILMSLKEMKIYNLNNIKILSILLYS